MIITTINEFRKVFENSDDAIEIARLSKYIKDIEVVRPRMVPCIKTDGMMSTQGTKHFDLYLQDEACDICMDKYGYAAGLKYWEWLIDQRPGAMFAATAKFVNEKYKMLQELNLLNTYGTDYFARSYYDIWSAWKQTIKK